MYLHTYAFIHFSRCHSSKCAFSEQKRGKENEYGTTAGEVIIRNKAYTADNIAKT